MHLKQRLTRAFIFYGTNVIIYFFRLFPISFDTWLGAKLGIVAYALLKREREKAISNILKAFPDRDIDWAKTQIKKSFASFGRSIMELIKLDTIVKHIDEYIKVENFELFQSIQANEKGVIWITGHIGNWELMPVYFAQKGYETYVVAKQLYDPRMDRLLNGLREKYGVHPVIRGSPGSGKKILKAIRSNSILGMLIDQDTDVQGVFVRFFNDLAFTPRGASDLAIKTEAGVIAGFITRIDSTHHVITLHAVNLPDQTMDYERKVFLLTQAMTEKIEEHIKQYPYDWVWMHSRWAKKPQTG
ncbi:MAG: lysophospholipid acyltransferase family protein [bacterium]